MDKKDLVIVGAGGFARELLWLLEDNNAISSEWNILGLVDQTAKSFREPIHGYEIIGDDEWLASYEHNINVALAVGWSSLRARIFKKLRDNPNIKFPSIVSRRAVLSSSVRMGKGCIVCASSVLTVDIQLADFVTICVDCTVGHDAVLHDFVTLYPSVNISGNVCVGSETEIGTGTNVIQGLTVGKKSIIGAGTVVVRDIIDNCTAVGNPARVIKIRER